PSTSFPRRSSSSSRRRAGLCSRFCGRMRARQAARRRGRRRPGACGSSGEGPFYGQPRGNGSASCRLRAAMPDEIAERVDRLELPRLAQGMAEKFISRFPFASVWTARCGQLAGLPEHAQRLLESERLLLVFPEGARGTAKLWKDRYSLVDFGTGFLRLALRTKSPIVPFAFLGGGDAIPTVTNLYKVWYLLGLPYLPLPPWLFPL